MTKVPYTSVIKCSHAKSKNTFVCTACYPFAMELGFIAGTGSLIYMANHPKDTATTDYKDGKFAILGGQGHRDDEIIIFEERPGFGEDDFLVPETLSLDVNDTVHIYEQAKKFANYNREKDGHFAFFLINKLDQLIKRWEKKNGPLKPFYAKFVKEREKGRK